MLIEKLENHNFLAIMNGDGDERWFSGWHRLSSTLGTDLVAHDFFQPLLINMRRICSNFSKYFNEYENICGQDWNLWTISDFYCFCSVIKG